MDEETLKEYGAMLDVMKVTNPEEYRRIMQEMQQTASGGKTVRAGARRNQPYHDHRRLCAQDARWKTSIVEGGIERVIRQCTCTPNLSQSVLETGAGRRCRNNPRGRICAKDNRSRCCSTSEVFRQPLPYFRNSEYVEAEAPG